MPRLFFFFFVPFPHSCFDHTAHLANPSSQVEIAADGTTWLVAGPRRRAFALREGEEGLMVSRLVPVRCGLIPLPAVSVSSTPPSAVRVSMLREQVVVLPPARPLLVEGQVLPAAN
jgi:hypothetical protein